MEKNKLIWQSSIKNMFNIVNYDLILTNNNIEDWKMEFNRLIGIKLNIKDGIMGDGNLYTDCLFE